MGYGSLMESLSEDGGEVTIPCGSLLPVEFVFSHVSVGLVLHALPLPPPACS